MSQGIDVAPQSREEFEQACRDICPLCAVDAKLRQRSDTGEHVHDTHDRGSFGHSFCLAHHFRMKYKDQFSG